MKKIIITGTMRSGTTALSTMLSYSPNILIMDELGLFHADGQNYHNRKGKKIKNVTNRKVLACKGLTEADIDNFYVGNFENKGNIEFFGDKFPDYCHSNPGVIGGNNCKNIVKNHSDAYVIFTYRNPCASIYSQIKRSKIENKSEMPWYFTTFDEAVNKLTRQTENWYNHIYPHIKNKFIVDYDYYVNNPNLLINHLSIFLNTKIDINLEDTYVGHNESFDSGSRSLYEHPNKDEYKTVLSPDEILYINRRTNRMNNCVKFLIKKQMKHYGPI